MTDFQSTIDNATSGGERWQLRCVAIDGSSDSIVPWPEEGQPWKEHCASYLAPNKYRIDVERINAGEVTEQAVRSALQRLRRSSGGPTSTLLDLSGSKASGAPTMFGPPAPARRAPTPVAPTFATDPQLLEIQRDTLIAEAEAAKAQAELNRRRCARELESQSAAKGPTNDVAAIAEVMRSGFDAMRAELRPRDNSSSLLAVLAPVAGQLLQQMLDSGQKRDALVLQLMTGAAAGGGKGATAEMLELLTVAKELVTPGEGGDGGGVFGQVLAALNTLRNSAPAEVAPSVAAPSPRAPTITPQDAQKMRTLMFLRAVQSYAEDLADPSAVAEELEQKFLLLPAEFRRLVLENGTQAMVAGLRRWMPAMAHDKLTAALASSDDAKAWLAQFVEALRDGLSSDSADDYGEDDEPPRMSPQPPRGALTAPTLTMPQPLTTAPPVTLFGPNGQTAPQSAEDGE